MSALKKAIQTALNLTPQQVVDDRSLLADTDELDAFVVVEKLYSTEIGQANRQFDGDNEHEFITSTLLTTVQITAFGNASYQAISLLKTFLQSSQGDDMVLAGGFSVFSMGDVKSMNADFGGGYEERAILEVVLSHGQVIRTDQKRIESVDFIYHKES